MTDCFGKILVVDDDESMRTTLSLLLKAEGHEVVGAKSEREAIRRIRKESFDLVITDLRMESHVSGIEVLKKVKRFSPQTEVVVATAFGSIKSAIDSSSISPVSDIHKIPSSRLRISYCILTPPCSKRITRSRLAQRDSLSQSRAFSSDSKKPMLTRPAARLIKPIITR